MSKKNSDKHTNDNLKSKHPKRKKEKKKRELVYFSGTSASGNTFLTSSTIFLAFSIPGFQ